MLRYLGFLYGTVCYFIFLAVFLYLIAFLSGDFALKGINEGAPSEFAPGLLVNCGLMLLFGLQHSVMSRPGFKQGWTRIVPNQIERSTYVLLASLMLAFIMWSWRPITSEIWSFGGPFAVLVWVIAGFGWVLVLASTFAINHFHLFGLQQVFELLKKLEPGSPAYKESWMYRLVRHPLMLGFIIAFWATPDMTLGRLIFSGGMTLYIVIALQFEERDLLSEHGESYAEYQERVPMLIPFTKTPRDRSAEV